MAKSHLIRDDSGSEIPFVQNEWVSATKTRNFLTDDPLLDWLNIHGLSKGFRKDTDYDIFHKRNGRIVIHFWDEEYLKNFPHKDGRKKHYCEVIK